MTNEKQPQFSKLRSMLFPVYAFELKKVLPMCLIFFFILFIYTCFRNIKDSLIVPACGAGAIAFLKLYFVLPCSVLFFVFYAKASNIFNKENLFYVSIIPFLGFFALFAFVLYPLKDQLHMAPETMDSLIASYPQFEYFFRVIGNWTFTAFYISAELWGSVALTLLFWQFANRVTRIPEAKRFYALFSLAAQFAMILSGELGSFFSKVKSNIPAGVDPWGESLKLIIGTGVIFGILCMVIYWWMHRAVLTDPRFYDATEAANKPKKQKVKLSVMESMKVIFTSPYLGLIAMLVFSYGTTVNLAEAVWKSQLKLNYPDPNAYNMFMSTFTTYTGIATMIMLVVGGNLLRMFRWATCAAITPLVMLLGGVVFFRLVVFREQLGPIMANIGTNPVALAVLSGAIVVICIKATKYALFDLTKEMSYIPLDEELKVKGKAAVDVIGGRFGKAGGAFFISTIIMIASSVTGEKTQLLDIATILSGIFIVFTVLWIFAVKALGKRVEAISGDQSKHKKSADATKPQVDIKAAEEAPAPVK